MRISDGSSDVCSSDLACSWALISHEWRDAEAPRSGLYAFVATRLGDLGLFVAAMATFAATGGFAYDGLLRLDAPTLSIVAFGVLLSAAARPEEHTSELQSLIRISYAVFCLKKKNQKTTNTSRTTNT